MRGRPSDPATARSSPTPREASLSPTSDLSHRGPEKVTLEYLSPAQLYPAGVRLFEQGRQPTELFYLHSGLVKLLRSHADGHDLILGLRGPGWLIGAAAAVLDHPHDVTAVALTECSVSRIPAASFRRLLRLNEDLSWKLHQQNSREIHEELAQIAELECLSARERLEQVLHRFLPATTPARASDEIRLTIPLRQWEIAQLVGVTPQYLCQLLGEMERKGLLRRDHDTIILPPTGLPAQTS